MMNSQFGSSPWQEEREPGLARSGRQLDTKRSRLWPDARVPYELAESIDYEEWQIMQHIFSNISSVTNIRFVPRGAKDKDYLLITEDIDKFGCGCCSIGLGE